MSIKYIFKYINEGPDIVTTAVEEEDHDEINDFYDCRYLSACEAAWRVFVFDMHHESPAVDTLPFHLPQEHTVFNPTESIDYTLEKESANTFKFLAWFELNKIDTKEQDLLYVIPKYYVWKAKEKQWTPRKQGVSIGRVHHVPLNWGELFYLRIMLNKFKGATSDNVKYPTYKEACYAYGLLHDKEYIDRIMEASHWGLGQYLCSYFVMLTLSESIYRHEIVWKKTWHLLADDVLVNERNKGNEPGIID
nr:AT hook motif protein, putative [Tanacetum cinerariifolium]